MRRESRLVERRADAWPGAEAPYLWRHEGTTWGTRMEVWLGVEVGRKGVRVVVVVRR